MTKKENIAAQLNRLGFAAYEEDFKVVKGPKCKLDIIECWHIYCKDEQGKTVEIASCHTMTELAKSGLVLEQADHNSQIYGDWLAVPPPPQKVNSCAELAKEGKL